MDDNEKIFPRDGLCNAYCGVKNSIEKSVACH